MCENTKLLKMIADALIKKEHTELDKGMTQQDMIDFVNSVATLKERADHIVRTNVFTVS